MMKDIINRLYEKIDKIPDRCYFNPPAGEEEFYLFEKHVKIELPDNIKLFYQHFNGGAISAAQTFWHKGKLQDKDIVDSILWNSNVILSLRQIRASIIGTGAEFDGKYMVEKGKMAGLEVLPLISTSIQEFLVLDVTNAGNSKVLDAFHEYPASEWEPVYNSFEELLLDYIAKEGNIETIGG